MQEVSQKSESVQNPEARQKPFAPQLERKLMRSLMRELFQTERSAQTRCRTEAERLRESTARAALEAAARHADAVFEELPIRARHHGLPVSGMGVAVGELFARARRHLMDYVMDNETSYRATLLGLRHGLDVWRLLRDAAFATKEDEFGEWCERIYQARAPLIEQCAQQLSWFAHHPDQATAYNHTGLLQKSVEKLKAQLTGHFVERTKEPAEKPA